MNLKMKPARSRLRKVAFGIATCLAIASSGRAQDVAKSQGRKPAIQLPEASGRHAIGTLTLQLIDSTRATSRRIVTRPLSVQVWYPARDTTDASASHYLVEAKLLDSMVAHQYLELPPGDIRRLAGIRLAGRTNARAATSPHEEGWPVLVLSHGMGVARSAYSGFAQDLASHGFVVFVPDHPIGGFTLAPDGRVLKPGVDPLHYRDQPLASVVHDWALDAGFIIRKFKRNLEKIHRLPIDTTNAGMVGHSLGGAAALEACRIDALFAACANMDGDAVGAVETAGIGKRVLVLLSEPDHGSRPPPRDSAEASRREDFARMGRQRDSAWAAICGRNKGVSCDVKKLKGTGHMSFSDAPFVAPVLLRGVGATLDPSTAHRAISDHLLAFFLAGSPSRGPRNETKKAHP